ncbi:phosphate ABC transporter permease PstA [Salirhabdus salicampi]|uniref:phosphate ABC transporter permease PstA n=1 Tax=Salirhabdus salicampi TaxID=476102 RepID=UPI0020C38C69|nr:phosphate ABC transporter permease PstA [Salirhabdus salicampi]MCP8616870.1 phosphate ABC transporter permease PstA [Salirhabdus salicampi]
MKQMSQQQWNKHLIRRTIISRIFHVMIFGATLVGLVVLISLLYRILTQGIAYVDWGFINGFPAPYPEEAGILAGIVGSLLLMGIVAPVSMIIGISTALYLEEYAVKNKIARFIQANIQNLAAVPSIVYGLLGLTFFVYFMRLGYTLIAGGLTMSLLVLPIVVVASQEAIRSVPNDLKAASFGMGASKWQTIVRVIMPAALPGILTGTILALSRAIGETAPLLIVGAAAAIFTLPGKLTDPYTVMPIQIYNWVSRPEAEWQFVSAAGIIVLLVILLCMNTVAVIIRNKFSRRL